MKLDLLCFLSFFFFSFCSEGKCEIVERIIYKDLLRGSKSDCVITGRKYEREIRKLICREEIDMRG